MWWQECVFLEVCEARDELGYAVRGQGVRVFPTLVAVCLRGDDDGGGGG